MKRLIPFLLIILTASCSAEKKREYPVVEGETLDRSSFVCEFGVLYHKHYEYTVMVDRGGNPIKCEVRLMTSKEFKALK